MTTAFQPDAFQQDSFEIDTIVAPPIGGKGDNAEDVVVSSTKKSKQRPIIKPTGLLDRPITAVDVRVEETRQIHEEVFQRVSREFVQEPAEILPQPIVRMSISEIDAEIGSLLRKKMRLEDDEAIFLFLIAASE